jgi:hypothetical protein
MNGLNADASVIFNLVAASLVLIFGLLVCGVMLSLFPPWMRSFLGGARR